MVKIKVYGNQKVEGVIPISGAKNAALPLMAASILSNNGLKLKNVPPLLDVDNMLCLLENLGVICQVDQENTFANSISLKTDAIYNFLAPYDMVKKMRASILVLGSLLARYGRCKVSLPGGCAIGVRPIDLHLKGMEALGAKVELRDGYICASTDKGLRGVEYKFPIVTVTGTENIMMAATLAEGTTVLKNSAQEPEVVDLANCLNKMGAKISGQGTKVISIKGVSDLHWTEHNVLPDRIEAGSYMIAAGITKGCIDLQGGNFRELLPAFIEKMKQVGLTFCDIDGGIRVQTTGALEPACINTAPHPGFPTDLQAQTMAMLCIVNGESYITENIWENRFMHAAELARMGADITLTGHTARIRGVPLLHGAPVMSTDLRASFSLLLAALAAKGESIVDRVYHLERGYCCIVEKLARCGVVIDKIKH
ncbi:MAG: UDP-N-acetylglucosamine 1-carboxyvinyltransferase [Holosporaceae bacterium]|nr:UDP-N-acetylglucosamine 1-carboxyvinyltransferase [Holosporaceae bacterium]